MPGFLFSYQKFRKEYEIPVVKDQDRQALERLHRLIGPFILRRLKSQVLKELPEKLETVVYSRAEGMQKELYLANAALLKEKLESGGFEEDPVSGAGCPYQTSSDLLPSVPVLYQLPGGQREAGDLRGPDPGRHGRRPPDSAVFPSLPPCWTL